MNISTRSVLVGLVSMFVAEERTKQGGSLVAVVGVERKEWQTRHGQSGYDTGGHHLSRRRIRKNSTSEIGETMIRAEFVFK
jgi:hypothetical protein